MAPGTELLGQLIHAGSVYRGFVSASLRSEMGYRRSFLLEIFGRMVVTGLELVAILFLFRHIESIGGWTQWEVVYLYALASTSLGVAELLTSGLGEMSDLVRTGDFDGILLRPYPSLLQVLGRRFRLLHFGRMIQGLVALVLAFHHLGLDWDGLRVVFFAVSVGSAVTVYVGLFVASAAQCFWTVESTEMFNAFTYGGAQMTQYPVSIYRPWLRAVFFYLVPVGFVSYFPALVVLGKPDALRLPPILPYLAPVVALVFFVLCLALWRRGVHRYESAGS